MLEKTLVIVLAFIAFAIIEGWMSVPAIRSKLQLNIKYKENPIRFGLRTLLIATTLFALLLATAAYLRVR